MATLTAEARLAEARELIEIAKKELQEAEIQVMRKDEALVNARANLKRLQAEKQQPSFKQMTTLEQMEDEMKQRMKMMDNEYAKMEQLIKMMDNEYEKNKESPLYLELYTKFCELKARYDAAKKEEEEFWDEFNHRRKRCIYCGGYEFGEDSCPSRLPGATGPCPLSPANIAKKIENLADPVTSTNPPN
jgi:chromosome segregation ATPase